MQAVDGIVTGHTFLGRHARLLVQALGQSITVSTTDLSAMAHAVSSAQVRFGWTDDDAQLLADGRSQ
jgi:hypothetical protein